MVCVSVIDTFINTKKNELTKISAEIFFTQSNSALVINSLYWYGETHPV